MSMVLSIAVGGVFLGLMYGLTGMGLTFTMGFGKTMNVAHGTFILLGAFLTMTFCTHLHLGMIAVIPLVIIAFGLLAGLLNGGLFSFLGDKSEIVTLLILFGLAEVIENVTAWIWTSDVQSLTVPGLQGVVGSGPMAVPIANLLAALLAIAVAVLLYLFLRCTNTGKAIRASAQSEFNARILGVNTARIRTIVFAVGIVLAGLAGVAVAILFPFTPQDQDQWLVMSFIVVVIGGVDNVLATLLAGLVIGVAQSLAGMIVAFQYQNLILYGFLAIALILRNGQLARRVRTL